MEQAKWTERKFSFDFPETWLPNILERLRGTGTRLAHMTQGLSEADASNKAAGKWSVKEHIGHLTDLEDLHSRRIDELASQRKELSPADMTNKKTYEADHNSKPLQVLINNFTKGRTAFVTKVLNFDPNLHSFSGRHPRLNMPMRLVDLCYFVAEHDDHHLASIRQCLEGG